MKIELKNFIIESDKKISYIDTIISTLKNNACDILDFFELDKLSKKKKIIIFTDREKYKEHMLRFVSEFKEWMCGDTCDDNINLLEIDEARKSNHHKDMSLDEFTKMILHEFVHSCQQELSPNGVTWYWEALATNLSGQDYEQINLSNCDFNSLRTNFNNTKNGYQYAYTLGKFMLENYSKDELLEYIKNPDLLIKDADSIFESAKKYQLKIK